MSHSRSNNHMVRIALQDGKLSASSKVPTATLAVAETHVMTTKAVPEEDEMKPGSNSFVKESHEDESNNRPPTTVNPSCVARFSSSTHDNPSPSSSSSSSPSSCSAIASALVVSASDKAGMEGIDRTRIDAIILRESGNSAYMKQQRKRDEQVDAKIEELKRRLLHRDRMPVTTKTTRMINVTSLSADAPPPPSSSSSSSTTTTTATTTSSSSSPTSSLGWRRIEEIALQPELNRLLSTRPNHSTCVVIDMDSFYISCELLTRPELQNVPACVGTNMILTSNYKARRYGVRSAMAGYIGDKLVSELSNGKEKLVHVPSNFDLYTQMSFRVRNVLAEYDPNMRAYSLDEAYLDIGPYLALRVGKGWSHDRAREALLLHSASSSSSTASEQVHEDEHSLLQSLNDDRILTPTTDNLDCAFGERQKRVECDQFKEAKPILDQIPPNVLLSSAATVVSEMRSKVKTITGGLTCSAGVASNFMLAKIASDKNKPNGQLIIGPSNDDIVTFIHKLPVRKIPGIGRVTEKMLHAFNIHTVQQLYNERAVIKFLFKPATANFLLRASLGWSNSDPSSSSEGDVETMGRKGISRERTFRAGKSWAEVNTILEDIVRGLCADMIGKNLRALTITLKVKLQTFDVFSRSKTMSRGAYVQSADKIIPIVSTMLVDLKKEHGGRTFSIRLLGVRCSNFQGEDERIESGQLDIQQFLCRQSENRNVEEECSPVVNPEKVKIYTNKMIQSTEKGVIIPEDGIMEGVNDKNCTTDFEAKQSLPIDPKASAEILSVDAESFEHSSSGVRSREKIPVSPSPPHKIQPEIKCPLCNSLLVKMGNDELNRHIDSCLNSSAVRDIVRRESAVSVCTRPRKKQRLTDFFRSR